MKTVTKIQAPKQVDFADLSEKCPLDQTETEMMSPAGMPGTLSHAVSIEPGTAGEATPNDAGGEEGEECSIMEPKPLPSAADIRRYLDWKRIPVRTVAKILGVDHCHLRRVLSGERPGSRALLNSVIELAEVMAGERAQCDVRRLIGAAVQMFFLRRGKHYSEVWRRAGPPGGGKEWADLDANCHEDA